MAVYSMEGTQKDCYPDTTVLVNTVTSGSQKCCKNCQKKQTNARKAITNSKYTKANYDSIIFYVPKGQREEIKAYAQSQGLSVNKLIQTDLEEYRKKL